MFFDLQKKTKNKKTTEETITNGKGIGEWRYGVVSSRDSGYGHDEAFLGQKYFLLIKIKAEKK